MKMRTKNKRKKKRGHVWVEGLTDSQSTSEYFFCFKIIKFKTKKTFPLCTKSPTLHSNGNVCLWVVLTLVLFPAVLVAMFDYEMQKYERDYFKKQKETPNT